MKLNNFQLLSKHLKNLFKIIEINNKIEFNNEFIFNLTLNSNNDFFNFIQDDLILPGIIENNIFKPLFYFNNKIKYIKILNNYTKVELLIYLIYELNKLNLINIVNAFELIYEMYIIDSTTNKNNTYLLMKILGIKPIKEKIDFAEWIFKLNNNIKQDLLTLELNHNLILELSLFYLTEIKYILDLFKQYPFSLNEKKSVMLFLFDIKNRDNIEIHQVLNKTFENKIEILDFLKLKRNPNLENKRNIMKKNINNLNLPKNFKILYDDNFENNNFNLNISFKNFEQLEKILLNKSLLKELSR